MDGIASMYPLLQRDSELGILFCLVVMAIASAAEMRCQYCRGKEHVTLKEAFLAFSEICDLQ